MVKRKRDESDSSLEDISIRNLPTQVDFSVLTEQVGTYISRALVAHSIRAVKRQDDKERESVDLVVDRDDKTEQEVLAQVRLIPQGRPPKVSCKGYGFIIRNTTSRGAEIPFHEWADTLSKYASQAPLIVTTFGGVEKQAGTILFRCGSSGRDVEEALRAAGRAKQAQLVDDSGAKLLAMIQSHGGTMDIKHWPKKDRRGVSDFGKRRKIKPAEAAQAAGVIWNGQTQQFSLKKEE